jgi:hypothetical protein
VATRLGSHRPEPPVVKADDITGLPSRGRELRDLGYGSAVRWGLAISVLIHLVLLLYVSRLLEIGALAWDTAFPRSGPIPDALEIVDVREVTTRPTLVFPEAPVIDPARRPPADAPVGVEVPQTSDRPGLTNAQRLQPRAGDMRLWRDWRNRPLGDWRLRGLARGDSALLAAIDRLYDSLGLNELERSTLDWLMETEGGKKWGITPEAIYLGTITLPNIFSALFEPTGPVGRDLLQQARDRSQIDQQDIETHWSEVVKERQRQIRERSREEVDRRRREEEGDEEVVPDSVTAE